MYYTSQNQLLAALSESEYQHLAPHLEKISLAAAEILYKPGEKIKFVYFPLDAMISFTSSVDEHLTIEVALVGNEGMVGLPVFWGGDSTINTAIVQIKGNTMKLDADVLRSECIHSKTLRKLLLIYTQALFTQVSQNGVCRANHTIEKQLARWLLSVQDCIQ
ncbi:MAG: Crp/Fnr family transcriptional regulator, partial [Rivularia sp. (in: cyanobacteria)]